MSSEQFLDQLAEEFVARHRSGERPTVTDYIERHPELADEIRELFSMLLAVEELAQVEEKPRPIPDQLGEYRILREVGRGGMGVVYEADQESLGRHVALKVLPFHSRTNPTVLERFRREAQAAARLHHSNIVPVFGVGEHEGVHYCAMQFLHGQPL
ncbi:MAG: protein kinase domain-containing protein, partial [Planctomycetota bacterium]